ncbi:HAD family hydrolase [Bacillus tianshenii]|uniref:HAD family hydrolase n=1 Tax=Sutcliffiella tianshenii TaxID=1463404 RepID=UPI00384D0D10
MERFDLKAIIFDMDGTLFQTDKILELSLDDTFDFLRERDEWHTLTPIDKYREIMGVPLEVVWETLLPLHSNQIREKANEIFLEILIENIRNGKGALYPNVLETLSFLKENGYSIFIASNGLTDYLKAIVTHYQLEDWVTETFSIQQIDSLEKGELVKGIVDKYGITSGAVVGDRLSDINAAKANRLLAVGCNFDFAKEEELALADLVIDDLMDLKMVVNDTVEI